ncbi:MAG: hypothetical protein AAF628_31380 [Planctomycetota bacterium]
MVGLASSAPSAQDDLATTLAEHPFFQRVHYVVEERGEFAFVLHQPEKAAADYNRQIINWFLPHARELHAVFLEQYVRPLGLKRTDGRKDFWVAVLSSKGAYSDYLQAVDVELHWTRAHFNPLLGLAVTYEDSFAKEADQCERRIALLHELIHAMQHAYDQGDQADGMPRPTWFNEGLADYLSTSTNVARSLRKPGQRSTYLEAIAHVAGQRSEVRSVYLAPLDELMAAESYADVIARVRKKEGADADNDLAMLSFYAQSWALAYFLHRADDGRYRPRFDRYMRAVTDGMRHAGAFEAAFPDTSVAALDIEFRTWLAGVMRERGWSRAARAMARSAGAVAMDDGQSTAAPGDQAAAEAPPAEFDYERLAWLPVQWPERLASAVRAAAQGHFARAVAAVEQIDAPAAVRPRIDAARRRLQDVATLREVALQKAMKARTLLRVGGARRRVKSVDAETVTLFFGQRTEPTAIATLGPEWLLDLAKQKRQLFEGAPAAALAGLEILAGRRAAAERRLRGSLEGQAGLVLLAERHTVGDGLDWGKLAGLAPPADAAAARAQRDFVVDTLRQHAGDPLLLARRAELMDLIRYLGERGFDLGALDAVLGAQVEALGNGRVRLTYNFEDQAQARDLIEGYDDLEMIRGKQPQLGAAKSYAAVRNGRLELSGAVARRIGIPMLAPLSARYTLKFKDAGQTGRAIFLLGLCANARGYCIVVNGTGGIDVLDSEVEDHAAADERMFFDKTYHLRVVHDGDGVTSFLEGERVARIEDVGSRTGGHAFVWFHAKSAVHIDDLEFEGAIDGAGARALAREQTAELLQSLWR